MADLKKKKENKHWFKDMKSELKKVTWLTPNQLVKNTAAVITIVLIVTVIVFVLDVLFESLNKNGVEKLKVFVQGNEIISSEENAENQDSEDENLYNVVLDEEQNETEEDTGDEETSINTEDEETNTTETEETDNEE